MSAYKNDIEPLGLGSENPSREKTRGSFGLFTLSPEIIEKVLCSGTIDDYMGTVNSRG